MKEPILITGAARSGTSMVAGIINLCGAFGGVMSPPNKNNEKGMFENVSIRNNVVKPYLKGIGVDPMGQYPLPDIETLNIPFDWRNRVENVIKLEGYVDGPWMYKGAKMCLFWPVWEYAFPNAKWIIVRRKDEEIVHSCLNTGFMRAFAWENNVRAVNAKDEKDAWFWWVRQHNRRFVEMIEEGLNVKQVWPEKMINGDYSQIYEMVEWLGLKWNPEVPNFIEPKLYKTRAKIKN